MPEVTADTVGKEEPDTNPSDQKLLDKKQRDLLRRERIRKFGEQLLRGIKGCCGGWRRLNAVVRCYALSAVCKTSKFRKLLLTSYIQGLTVCE